MSVVLSILQIIGWVLLIALLLALSVLFVVLFCPACYLVEGEWQEEKWAKTKAHWLLHLLRVKISYGDNLIFGEVQIFWKKITFSFNFTKKDKAMENEAEEMEPEEVESETEIPEDSVELKEKVIGTETLEELRRESNEDVYTDESTEDADTDATVEDGFEEKKESIISKIKGMIERIKVVYAKVKRILYDEKNQAAGKHLKKEIIYLIKILLPKKSKIDAVFSTGAPDTTGQLFGILACFPIMYSKEWKLLPDFTSDEAYFKGTFWGKGKVYGYQIVGIFLRILFDKNCRRLYTMINRFVKWMKKDEKSEVK